MKKKFLLTLVALVCALCCAFGLVACDNGDKPDGSTQTIAVESVTLNETTLRLEIDDEETLTATVAPDDATEKTVTWSSSAPTVASVDGTGKVTAKAEGNATITATTVNNKTATCEVTVNAAILNLSVAGKTFICTDMTCDSIPAEALAAMKEASVGSLIIFIDDSNFTRPDFSQVDITGTYTFSNGTGTMTVIPKVINVNGDTGEISVEDGPEITMEFTFDGNELILSQELEGIVQELESIVVIFTCVLKPAE